MCREKHSLYRVWCHPQFPASPGGLGMYPLQIRGDYCAKLEIRVLFSDAHYHINPYVNHTPGLLEQNYKLSRYAPKKKRYPEIISEGRSLNQESLESRNAAGA